MAIVVQVMDDTQLLSRIPGVTITLVTENEKRVITVTDFRGCATFSPVKPDTTYLVRAELDGMHAVEQKVFLEGHEKRLLKLLMRSSLMH